MGRAFYIGGEPFTGRGFPFSLSATAVKANFAWAGISLRRFCIPCGTLFALTGLVQLVPRAAEEPTSATTIGRYTDRDHFQNVYFILRLRKSNVKQIERCS